jgi:nucleotide-binding universal stress UspA family protein
MKQISKILIAYDGSACSRAALSDLLRAGLPAALEAVVATIAFVFLPQEGEVPDDEIVSPEAAQMVSPTQEHAVHAVQKALAVAKEAAARVQANFPTWSVRTEADGDSPAWAVIRFAEALGVDLVVVGSNSHLSAGGRLILGSVSQRVLHDAPCSVRVARCSDEQREGPVRIVAGFNGSPDAKAAVEAIAARTWPERSEVRVIAAGAAAKPTMAVEKLRASGLITSEVQTDGEPAHSLIKEAENWGADSIFVGTRDMHGFPHLLHGSVSSAVAASARCSVEVIRVRRAAA